MNYEVLSDRILVERIEEEIVEKTEGGIILPNSALERKERDKSMFYGEVKVIGKDVEFVKLGDIIVFNRTGANLLYLDGQSCYLVPEQNILAKRTKKE